MYKRSCELAHEVDLPLRSYLHDDQEDERNDDDDDEDDDEDEDEVDDDG